MRALFQPCRFTALHALVMFVALLSVSCAGVFDSAKFDFAELRRPVAERPVAQVPKKAPIAHYFTELPGDERRSIDLYLADELRRQRQENASTSGRISVEQLHDSEPSFRITPPAGPRLVDM